MSAIARMFKFFVLAFLIASAYAENEDAHAETKLWKMDIGHEGWESIIETSNHIRQAASGDKHGNMQGEVEYIDPKGEHITLKYIADEHGYQPVGDYVNEIPDYILKSIEYIKAHPYHEDEHEHHH